MKQAPMKQAIVDSHIHFWDTTRFPYAWLEGAPSINKAYLPEDLTRASQGAQLEQIVFVQAGLASEHGLAEATWVSKLAKADPRIKGIVAEAPLERGEDVKDDLAALSRLPLVKGVRRLIQSEALGFARDEAFIQGVKLLPSYGFSFDLCIYHSQLLDVLYLVERCPEVSFVLDHIGKPDIKAGLMEPWASQMRELAAFSNVHCKLSGMVTEADQQHWQAAELQPYAEQVLSCFGVQRLMYGGDWPVSELASDWLEWLDTADGLLGELSAEDKNAIFHDNAIAFYRLS